ncbi:MAG TPA: ATP-binding protein [Thermoanaerobaculia bacterium]|nr:ATP-binding protein [Thermoanaerobaculia bacterium]
MHPVRLLLISSVGIAVLVALLFGYFIHEPSSLPLFRSAAGAVTLSSLVMLVFLLPALGIYVWSLRSAAAVDRLTDGVRDVLRGETSRQVTVKLSSDEIQDLARSVDEMRQLIVRQQQSFEEQKALLSEIVGGLREGLLAINARKRVIFANGPVSSLFNLDGPVVGRSLVEVLRHETFLTAFDRALEGAESMERVSVYVGAEERRIESRVFPVGKSSEVAAIALFIDVTRIERLETVRRHFISDFLHESRTPLAGLRSAVESLDARPLELEAEKQLRHITQRQLGRLERLVRSLAELNSIESGDVILQPEATELAPLLEDVVAELDDALRAAGIRVNISGDATAFVDPMRTHQIFMNLIDNAIKHAGTDSIEVSVTQTDGEAITLVRDYGVGIPPGEQEKIFHRFHRMDKSRSQKVIGTGLGLAITKHLVLQHGGRISVESAGKGAVFEVRLPKRSSGVP